MQLTFHAVTQNTELKAAGVIANQLKESTNSKKWLANDIKEYLANYTDVLNDLNANESRRLKYVHNLFDDEAERLYCNPVHSRANSFWRAYNLLRK